MMSIARASPLLVVPFVVACGPEPEPASPPTAQSVAPHEAGIEVPPLPPPASVAAPEGASKPLRLCSWNMKKLGHGSKDYAALARVLEDNCDASVVLEVMQSGGAHPGYQALLNALGNRWTGLVTQEPRPKTTSGNSEFYAVVWRDDDLTECEGWSGLRYVEDNDGSGSDPGEDLFVREPAYGCFVLARAGGVVDFLLAAYHATWEDGSTARIQAEVKHLDAAVAQMLGQRPGEKDVLVLGDFNLVSSKLSPVITMTDWTVGAGSTLNSAGDVTSNLYDHVLVYSKESTPEVGEKADVLDVRDAVADGSSFYSTVSDHLPIRTMLTVGGADDD